MRRNMLDTNMLSHLIKALLMDFDIPDCYKLNFAIALLMERNINGCLHALGALQDSRHPPAEQLLAAIAGWQP